MTSTTRNGIRDVLHHRLWSLLHHVIGESPDLKSLKATSAKNREQLEARLEETAQLIESMQDELGKARNERLEWMAREANVRKDLQDVQERNKDLLEQVVQLTHKQRQAQQNLLDQKFKTEATPLERQRHEMDMAQARENERKAKENERQALHRCRKAEERMAHLARLEHEAAKVKQLQEQLAWAQQQRALGHQALEATVRKLALLEVPVAKKRASKTAKRKPYRRPAMTRVTKDLSHLFS